MIQTETSLFLEAYYKNKIPPLAEKCESDFINLESKQKEKFG